VIPANPVINEIVLYILLALGAVGVALALPRRGLAPAPVGGLIAAAAGGLILLALGFTAQEHIPNFFFYVFAAVGLGAALRMITHPRPVYAALYFILTILASAGLFVLLAAEFLAFALIIIYAGAILITYLFVIMLATQAPVAEDIEHQAEYDAVSREPVIGTAVGFLLLAVLTTMMFRGVNDLPPPRAAGAEQALLAQYPGKVDRALRNAGLLQPGERIAADASGLAAVDVEVGTATVVHAQTGATRIIHREQWPPEMWVYNVESVGWDLLAVHPGAIEIAGIILLMAMLGAVVLARRQVQLDEEAKARHADYLIEKHGRIGAGRIGGEISAGPEGGA
jgi:NADH-quinone oxidoreductase subunit J